MRTPVEVIMKSVRIAAVLACLAALPAQALADEGEDLFKKQCKKCHEMTPNKHAVGPSLTGVFGRKAGSTDFKKYKALTGSQVVWDEKSLDGWLENPKKFIGKTTTMTEKVKSAEDRAALIQYLKGL